MKIDPHRGRGGGRRRRTRPRDEPHAEILSNASVNRFNLLGYTDALAIAAAIAGPLLLYAFTAPRTVVLEDDGWFLVVGKFLGVGHPPGYPVHTLISNLFLKIPWGSTAFLGHLLSGILGALACGAVYVCARLLGAAAVFALIGAWLFAVSEHFWAQAIITEVYTLNALFFFTIFALLLYLRRNPGDGRAWIAAALLYGLSLANHWPLMVLASPGLLLAVAPVWRDLPGRWPKLAGAFLLGVIPPYIWMVWRSLQEPTYSFSGPLNTLEQVIFHIARRGYTGEDASVSAGWSDRFQYFHWLGGEFIWQLTLPGFLLALLGLAVLLARPLWRLPRPVPVDGLLDWIGRWAGPAAFAGSSVGLLLLLNFDFSLYRVQVFRPYSLICYGLLGIWLALGLHYATYLAGRRIPWPVLQRPRLVLGISAAAGLAMAAWSLSAHWDTNNRAGADFAERYADMVFDTLPTDAVLIARGDAIVFPLAYYYDVERRRPDTLLFNAAGLLFHDSPYPSPLHATPEMQQQALQKFIAGTERRVFYTSWSTPIDHGRRVRDYGFLREDLEIGGTWIEFGVDEVAEEYFASLFEREYHDGWELLTRNNQVHQYGWHLGFAFFSGNSELVERAGPLRELAMTDYHGLLGMAEAFIVNGKAEQLEQAMEWLKMAEPLRGDAYKKSSEAALYYNMGEVRSGQGRVDEAIVFYEKSRDIWPHPDNPAVKFLDAQR